MKYSLRGLMNVAAVGTLILAVAYYFVMLTRTNEIEFILPSGFRGPFVIMFDPNGVSGDFVNGKLTLRIPKSRIVRMRSMSAFMEMTHRSARFDDGLPLEVEHEHEPNRVLLRTGGKAIGIDFPQHDGYFVGTEAEHLKGDYAKIFKDAGLVKTP